MSSNSPQPTAQADSEANDTKRAALALHRWRHGYNGEDVGYGTDELLNGEESKYHFPHAYAVWGTGYCHLFRATGEQEFLNSAERCGEWLIENRSPSYENMSWGLPLTWQGVPSEVSYAITTLYCADLFFELNRETKRTVYADALRSIGRWLTAENGYVVDTSGTDGIWFRYAPDPRFVRSVCNVTAKCAGFFGRLSSITSPSPPEDLYFACSCARYTLGSQLGSGAWSYNDKGSKIDLIHSALVIEGLCDFAQSTGLFRGEVEKALDTGTRFVLRRLVAADGFAYEEYPLLWAKPSKASPVGGAISVLRRLLLPRTKCETRSYGYGMILKAISKCESALRQNGRWRSESDKLTRHLIRSHATADGHFGIGGSTSGAYIRAQGHIFEGLCNRLPQDARRAPSPP